MSFFASKFSVYHFTYSAPWQLVAFPARGLLSLIVFERTEHAASAHAAMHQRPFPDGHGISPSPQHLVIRYADVRDAENCAAANAHAEAERRAAASGSTTASVSSSADACAADADLSSCSVAAGLPPPATVTQCYSACIDPVRNSKHESGECSCFELFIVIHTP